MKMIIDAMDLLYRERVHGFGIMSSDSDSMPLAMRIRQDGLPVYGFGNAKTPQSFQQACSRFIDVTGLVAAEKDANGRKVIDEAVQMYGAQGISQDTPLARMWTSVRTLRLADGPDAVHRRQVARTELKRYTNERP